MSEGRYAEAAAVYRELLKAVPGNPGLQMNLGMALHLAGKDRESLPVFAAVLKAQPDAFPALVMCAASYLRLEQPALAIPLLERARKLNPDERRVRDMLADAHGLSAELLRRQRRHKESVAEWKRALAIRPEDAELQQELAVSTYSARDYAAAEGLLRKLRSSPDNDFMLGDSLLNQQKIADAIPYLVRAVTANAANVFAHSSLGRAYVSAGQPLAAVPHLERAREIDDDGSIHYQLARAYQAAGEREKAAAAMKRYQELNAAAASKRPRSQ